MYMGSDRYAWSESIYLTSGASPSDGIPGAIAYANARLALCAPPVTTLNLRISSFPANRFTLDLDPATYQTVAGPYIESGENFADEYSDRPYSAVLVYMTGVPHSRRVYLSGCPDVIIGQEPQFVQGLDHNSATFVLFFGKWAKLLGSGAYGFRVRTKLGDTLTTPPLTTTAVGGLNLVTITVPLPFINTSVIPNRPYQAGDDLYGSGWRRISTRFPGLNGTFRIALAPTPAAGVLSQTYVLQGTANVPIANFYGPGLFGPCTYAVQTIDTTPTPAPGVPPPRASVIAVKAVAHKRGGSYALPRGRSRTRS